MGRDEDAVRRRVTVKVTVVLQVRARVCVRVEVRVGAVCTGPRTVAAGDVVVSCWGWV